MVQPHAKFTVGQIIQHKLFGYRGVIIDVDPCFQHSQEWYRLMAKTNPAKDQPWYQVLVDETDLITYVAEQNISPDQLKTPIHHPDLKKYFKGFDKDHYTLLRRSN